MSTQQQECSKNNSPSGATEDYESEEENYKMNSSSSAIFYTTISCRYMWVRITIMLTIFLSFYVTDPKQRGVNKNIKLEREVHKNKNLLRKGEKFKLSVIISMDENRPVGE